MENSKIIAKRINIESNNFRKLKIMATLFEDELKDLNDKKKIDYIINRAIESYYASDEIKRLLEL